VKLPEFSVNRPVTTLMIFFAVVILGAAAMILLPIDFMPKIEIPSLGVVTTYEGASAEDIETKITKILENNLSSISNIKEVTSTSDENSSVINLSFEWGTNLDESANDVRQVLDLAQQLLPEDAERPILIKFDLSMMPILFFGITAEESYPDLRDIIDERFADPLKRLPGVAMTLILGGLTREIHVEVDRQRLEAYGLSIDGLVGTLAAENITQPAGNLKVGLTDYILRVPGEFRKVEEIGEVVIGQSSRGSPIHLREVAEVKDSFKDIDRRVRINRREGLLVMVQKQSGANTVTVADRVKKALPEIEAGLPGDVKVITVMDSSDFIRRSITNLTETLLFALLFVLIVVWLFLREFRGSFIIGVTIPFSLIVAFVVIYILGYTINVMSLSALVIAMGMVVDDAIVVYENIYRHRDKEGESRREAAIFGTSEVGVAVMAATFTLMAIFFPVMFVPGITGIMFRELSLAIIIVLGASLFSSFTLTPMLASRMVHVSTTGDGGRSVLTRLKRTSETAFSALESGYKSVLHWSLGHRRTVIVSAALLFIGSLLVATRIGTEFTPTMDQGEISGYVDLPTGTRIEKTDQIMDRVETLLENSIPEAEVIYARCGESESAMAAYMGGRGDVSSMQVGAHLVPKKQRNRSDADITYSVRRQIEGIPGVKAVDFAQANFMQRMMSGGGKPVEVEIYGDDIAATDSVALRVKNILDRIPGLTDVTISRQSGKPELWLEVDREKAASLGLNMSQISTAVRTQFYGKTATLYREAGDEYDTFVRLRQEDRSSLEDVLNAVVMTPSGQLIPVRNFATVRQELGPLTIERKDQIRVVSVSGGLYGRSLGEVVGDIREGLLGMAVPTGVSWEIGGSAKDQAESFKYLALAFILGVVLVYMIMAAQFESLLDPFIIMFSVPFGVVGVIWALLVTGKTFNIISIVGMVMLVGIVVKNAIVLVDYINIMRSRGLGIREAIEISGPRRLRPILMTAATTMLGLLPMAVRTGEGAETWTPLAVAVIGGLLLSTLVSLVLVPVVYSLFEERVRRERPSGR
jgi:HAE1 family hydrophobic/amphiphilic exporter-1